MDGAFVFERKSPTGVWSDATNLPLSKLKAEEWVKIDLKASELLTLFEGLKAYYELVAEHGVPRGRAEYIPAPQSRALRALVLDNARFRSALRNEELASALLGGLIAWIAENERVVAAARFDGISLEDLQQFDAVLGLARLQRFCRELDDNMSNDDEAYWQRTLKSNGWAIAQVFAIPVLLIQSQVYVGGKLLTNRQGNTADFLYESEISGNVVVVEIKSPVTPLLGDDEYRNGVYAASRDLSGGLVQILHARKSLGENYERLMTDEMRSQRSLGPRGLLIVGSGSQLSNHARVESFELWRNSQRDLDIVMFDELRHKVGLMIQLLQNAAKS